MRQVELARRSETDGMGCTLVFTLVLLYDSEDV